jgi:cyclophilin family peptidyl-prolyl cis-trans isomerase
VTDANGNYDFFQVQPGTYTLTRSPDTDFIDGQLTVGNLGGELTGDAITTIYVAQGQTAVNYNFAVLGLAGDLISLRDFLNTSSSSDFLPTPGSGSAAADNSVQPSTPAATGTSSVAGTVLTAGGTGLAGVQIALTGTDNTGRDILQTTTTEANGSYQFTALADGSYNLNITEQPAGFRLGQPSAGNLGGNIFQNGQILNIQVGTGASGTGYNFTELPVAAPAAGTLAINAVLADDTAGPGGTTSDGITSDPSVQGSIASNSAIVSFQAGLDSTPAAHFVSIASSLTAGGTFYLNPAVMNQIAGGTLANGTHTLHLQAINAQGQGANFNLTFTLDDTAPTQPTLHMDSTSDPNQSGITTSTIVTLQGQTSAGVQVQLIQNGTVVGTTTASSTGAFSFANIHLAAGANDYTVQATDKAGNTSQLQTFFVEETGPDAVPTQPVNKSVSLGADSFVDLSSPTLFTDAAFSNSLITFNTNAGPINLELFDTEAPQTVANFFDYIDAGDYNNDIFHRLVQDFVLQGGGFTFSPSAHTLTAVTAGPDVPDEFDNTNRPNVLGTIAMAKESEPNTANSQFFFNLTDNTQTLGASNSGGFTVFGKVLSGADQRVLNTLAAATIVDESSFNSALNTLPLNNYTGSNFPTDSTGANYDLINSVTVVRQTEQLTYSVVSNSNSSAVTASIDFGQLDLHPVAQGTSTVVVQATDKGGKTAEVTFNVTVGPAVTVTNPGTQTNLDGDAVNLQIAATDASGGTLSYGATGLPSGLTVNSTSGLISGTLTTTAHTGSPYTVVVTATDGSGNSNNTTFTWDVNPVITISNIGNQTNADGDSVSLQVAAQDAKKLALTYSATNLPSGLSINSSTGLISGKIGSGASAESPYSVTVTVGDGTYSANQVLTWTVSP